MYVDSCTYTAGGKQYTRHLLRESFRENGKVAHRTLANLSHCSEAEIRAIKLALKHKHNLQQLGNINEDVSVQQGVSCGAVGTLWQVAQRLGLVDALGSTQDGLTLFEWVQSKCRVGKGASIAKAALHWLRLVGELNAPHIAHCDLQHANVLVTPRGYLKLEQSGYDKLLFRNEDFRAPTQSALYRDLLRSPDATVRDLAARLIAFAQGNLDDVPPLGQLAAG